MDVTVGGSEVIRDELNAAVQGRDLASVPRFIQTFSGGVFPHVEKSVVQNGHGGAANFHMRVSPARSALRERGIFIRDIQSAYEADLAVNQENFSMVSTAKQVQQSTNFPGKTHFAKGVYAHPCVTEAIEKPFAHPRAPGVKHEVDIHAIAGLFSQSVGKALAGLIVAKNVALHAQGVLRLLNGGQHRGVRFRAIPQKPHLMGIDFHHAVTGFL